jgi:hypothetical protein
LLIIYGIATAACFEEALLFSYFIITFDSDFLRIKDMPGFEASYTDVVERPYDLLIVGLLLLLVLC